MERVTADAIRERLGEIEQPIAYAVADFRVRIGEDWAGYPAVFVQIVLKDSEIRRAWPTRETFREDVRALLGSEAPSFWPYITFTSQSLALDPTIAA